MRLHVLDGASDTFNFETTCSAQTGEANCAAMSQKTDVGARPIAVLQLPRTIVLAAAVLSIYITIGRPGATTFASVKPKIAPAISKSYISPISVSHPGKWVCEILELVS